MAAPLVVLGKNPKLLGRIVGSLIALYDLYAIWSLGHYNVLLGAGIVGAVAALFLILVTRNIGVLLAGLALAGAILVALLGLAPAFFGPLVVLSFVPLVALEAERDEQNP